MTSPGAILFDFGRTLACASSFDQEAAVTRVAALGGRTDPAFVRRACDLAKSLETELISLRDATVLETTNRQFLTLLCGLLGLELRLPVEALERRLRDP